MLVYHLPGCTEKMARDNRATLGPILVKSRLDRLSLFDSGSVGCPPVV